MRDRDCVSVVKERLVPLRSVEIVEQMGKGEESVYFSSKQVFSALCQLLQLVLDPARSHYLLSLVDVFILDLLNHPKAVV